MRFRPQRRARIGLASICVAATLGCTTTVYHPMSGLHRPVAINLDYANFGDLEVSLQCLPGPLVTAGEARTLCQKLERLFVNQGATTASRTSLGRAPEDDGEPAKDAVERSALNVELSARLIHREESSFLWWSWTTDYTFAQDVAIRDETGFLLVRETLTGRFVRQLGFTSSAEADFSKDYYAQLAQLTLNAKVRRQVLAEGAR